MENPREELKNLASYLCVSCGQITVQKDTKVPQLKESASNGLTGLATIAKHLTRKSNKSSVLLGRSKEEEAQINQWLEYRVTHVDRCSSIQDVHQILKEINSHLRERVYVVGYHLTLADLILYYGLHRTMVELAYFDKQKYVHLSRWFNQVQHQKGVRQTLPVVNFMKTQIYGDYTH